ncbi:beta-1,4-glucuronyltransferase 1 [Serinus canaria]|uniref:beta-1,4-glucuronyltransferase 1 n=1 Tax=Serinus canaria TaxID=9135 RepID=UPI0021CCBA34|nr:beta-1,4-glucuronyltransferase 1 [Serinus canaria]
MSPTPRPSRLDVPKVPEGHGRLVTASAKARPQLRVPDVSPMCPQRVPNVSPTGETAPMHPARANLHNPAPSLMRPRLPASRMRSPSRRRRRATLYLRSLPAPRPPPRAPRPPRGVLDASGSFRVYWDVLGAPPGWARAPRPELVLATHGTPGRAAAALGGGSWGGPLSLAVFGEPRGGLRELLRLLGGPCRGLRGRLRLQVVQGAAGPPPRVPPPQGAPRDPPGGCRGALARLAAADPPSYSLGVPYPGNLLRNVAWQGAAGGGPGARPPPQPGGRFVLMVDADVEPSPGLREGFLELLRGGGLDPKNWGGLGGPDPRNGGERDPKNWGEQGDPKAPGARGDLGSPKTLGAPGGLGVSNSSGVRQGLSDPGVPNALGVPTVPKNPQSSLGPQEPRGRQAPSDPKTPSDPKILSDLHAPGAPHALGDPNTLDAPHAPGAPHPPGAPPWARALFVLPAFELRGSRRPPGSKAELLRLWGAGVARPFYGGLCPRCQAPTAFGRWRALPPGPPGAPRLRVAYEVPWRDPWEPFFVAPARGVPPFDEGFLQYGFNRISQACELHVAGFRFAVLDGAFVTHRGWKEPGGFHGGREAELGRNRRRYRAFKEGLKLRYPESPRRC